MCRLHLVKFVDKWGLGASLRKILRIRILSTVPFWLLENLRIRPSEMEFESHLSSVSQLNTLMAETFRKLDFLRLICYSIRNMYSNPLNTLPFWLLENFEMDPLILNVRTIIIHWNQVTVLLEYFWSLLLM